MEVAPIKLSDDAIRAIADPIERARILRAISRERGNLTSSQSRIYSETIAEIAGDEERQPKWIARKVGISRGRVFQLLALARTRRTLVATSEGATS